MQEPLAPASPTELIPAADTSAPPQGPGATAAARPYGLLGLVLSTIAIVLATIVILLLVAALTFGIAVAVLGLDGALTRLYDLLSPDSLDDGLSRRLLVVATLFQDGALTGAVFLAAIFRGGRFWRDLLAWKRWDVRRGVLLVLGLLVVSMLYNLGASALVEHAVPQSKDWTPTPTGTPWIVAFALLATIAAPLTEEVLFRGWIYTSLRRSFGIIVGLVVSSLLFAAAHWEKTHLQALTILPIGIVLGYIRERTGSIGPSMLFHALFNGLATIVILMSR